MVPTPFHFVVLALAAWLNREQQAAIEYLQEENRLLRQRLGPKRLRFTDRERVRLGRLARRVGRKRLRRLSTLASPETLLRWYRTLVARKYDGSRARSRLGRPPKPEDVRYWVLRMARDNPRWGLSRIVGALLNLGYRVHPRTVRRILEESGLTPRPNANCWSAFLRAHWGAIAATDFFSVEVLTFRGLVRYFVLFVIDLKSRRVKIAGIHHDPDGGWMLQIGRNLTDPEDGFLLDAKVLIHDRDPLFTKQFRQLLRESGVQPHRLPARSPNLNAYAERFVRSIKDECLSRVIPLGEAHLRWLVREYVVHYNTERNHQGLGNRLIDPPASFGSGTVRRRDRVGGLLRYYYREAA